MNPISVAIRGKGLGKFARRAVSICQSYGFTPVKQEHALEQLIAVLQQFECHATVPIVTTALARNPRVIQRYQAQGIEFAIHGYRHVDHFQLSKEELLAQVAVAKQLCDEMNIQVQGFRGPYLHANSDTLAALRRQGLAYDSSQGLSWDVLDGDGTPAYRHVLKFYGALPVSNYPSLPSMEGDLVLIPYSLPDDEALVNRLSLKTTAQMTNIWLAVLRRSYELGELFTLGLHPERVLACREPLTAVLSAARRLNPPVWIARLNEIAAWWQARAATTVKITDIAIGKLQVTIAGPAGTTMLARAVEIEAYDAPAVPWTNGYQQVKATTLTTQSPRRPFIGLSPGASPKLASFLRQQGYIVEINEESDRYSYYFDQTDFVAGQERPFLAQIEGTDRPLMRLGRWPNGAHSALAITGDIDALTLWDYGWRFIGK